MFVTDISSPRVAIVANILRQIDFGIRYPKWEKRVETTGIFGVKPCRTQFWRNTMVSFRFFPKISVDLMTPRPMESPITGQEVSLTSVPLKGAVPETTAPPRNNAESERPRDAPRDAPREELALQGVTLWLWLT